MKMDEIKMNEMEKEKYNGILSQSSPTLIIEIRTRIIENNSIRD